MYNVFMYTVLFNLKRRLHLIQFIQAYNMQFLQFTTNHNTTIQYTEIQYTILQQYIIQ